MTFSSLKMLDLSTPILGYPHFFTTFYLNLQDNQLQHTFTRFYEYCCNIQLQQITTSTARITRFITRITSFCHIITTFFSLNYNILWITIIFVLQQFAFELQLICCKFGLVITTSVSTITTIFTTILPPITGIENVVRKLNSPYRIQLVKYGAVGAKDQLLSSRFFLRNFFKKVDF